MQTLSAEPASALSTPVTTRMPRWQQKCWELAEAGLPFELWDIQTRHFMFCHWLRAEYNYTFTYKYHNGDSLATFRPGFDIR